MPAPGNEEAVLPADQVGLMRLARLAPRPKVVEDTGLSRELLVDLIAKHFLDRGTMSLVELSHAIALSGGILESLLDFMRSEALVEVRPTHGDRSVLHYGLTDRGRAAALDAMLRSGYVGPAPVTSVQYADIVRAQSIHRQTVSREAMHRAFDDIVIDQSLLDRLGSSVNSGRAIFLYGAAGTGKTFMSQRLTRVFPGLILVPHAIAIDNQVVQLFDPLMHKVADVEDDELHVLGRGHDRRFAICERPSVVTAGELTADMLEVMYEPGAKLYEAPLQMRANNGIFIIDDLGRQRIEPKQLFNRWIVPLEERKDYLSLRSGRHFSRSLRRRAGLLDEYAPAGPGGRSVPPADRIQDRVHAHVTGRVRPNLARFCIELVSTATRSCCGYVIEGTARPQPRGPVALPSA